jgi:hypothetical protein
MGFVRFDGQALHLASLHRLHGTGNQVETGRETDMARVNWNQAKKRSKPSEPAYRRQERLIENWLRDEGGDKLRQERRKARRKAHAMAREQQRAQERRELARPLLRGV